MYRKRRGYAQMPAPWNPDFNLPQRFRQMPPGFVRSHVTDPVLEHAKRQFEAGYQPPPFLMPDSFHPRKNPGSAARAILDARSKLRQLKQQARQAPTQHVPPPPYPTGLPSRPPKLPVPNMPPDMNGMMEQIQRQGKRSWSHPLETFDPRARVQRPQSFAEVERVARMLTNPQADQKPRMVVPREQTPVKPADIQQASLLRAKAATRQQASRGPRFNTPNPKALSRRGPVVFRDKVGRR